MNNLDEFNNNKPYSEINITEHWTNFSLLKQISKGATLRQQKLVRDTYQDSCDNINIIYDAPSTSKAIQFHQSNRKTTYRKPRRTKRKKSPKQCPIRIVELAVPSKRQCIDTWRTKSRVMPNFMVDRLKQRVMDEKPTVEITDALNCFKKRNKRSRNRTYTGQLSIVDNTRIRELKMLCAIFGFKLTLKLRRPMNLSLNSGLEQINTIVKEEIDLILRNKNLSRRKYVKNKETLEEISQKVTCWIINILEETDSKLLEEDLRDLEEEEGPILDLIDALIEEVMKICEPPSVAESSEKLSENHVSLSVLSSVESTEQITGVTEENIKQLIKDIYTDALEDVERQILQNDNDYLLFNEVSSFQKNTDLSLHSDDSGHIFEYSRGEVNTMVEQILGDLISGESSLQENETDDSDKNISQLSKQHMLIVNTDLTEENGKIIDQIENPTGLLKQENEKNIYKDLIESKETSILSLDFDSKNDDRNEKFTNSNTQIVHEILQDFLERQEWTAKAFEFHDNNAEAFTTPVTGTEAVLKHDILEAEDHLNYEADDRNSQILANERRPVEAYNDIQFSNEEKEGTISSPTSEMKQTIEDVPNTIFETVAIESFDGDIDVIEDNNKKVKFSAIDMDIGVATNLSTTRSGPDLLVVTPSSDYLKQKIDFAPPNEHLLSNADESWPQDMPLPTLKVTESVNKSVTSLGKIFEINEKGTSTESSYVSIQNSEIMLDVQLPSMSIDNSKINDMLLAPFQNEKKIEIKETTKTKNVKSTSKLADAKNQKSNKKNKESGVNREEKPAIVKRKDTANRNTQRKYKKNLSQELETKEIINFKDKSRQDIRLKHKTKLVNKADVKPKLIRYKNEVKKNKRNEKVMGDKLKQQFIPEIDKETKMILTTVHVTTKEDRGDDCKKEQNFKSYSCKKFFSAEEKTKLRQAGTNKIDGYDILKWCKGLENVIENLETWNAWMYSTCKCITYLKQKENAKSSHSVEKSKRKWKILQRNIEQDRILWKDMKRRNRDGLKSYKKYYYGIKVDATKYQITCDCSNK